MDCNFFNGYTLSSIVKNYSVDGVLPITEEIVKLYNKENTSPCRISFKTADNIAKQIRKIYK